MEKENFEYTYDGIITYLKRNKITSTVMVIGAIIGGVAFLFNSFNTVKDNISTFNVSSPKPTSGIATAISKRAYFYSDADMSMKRKAYIIEGQEVKYSKIKDDFIYAFYINQDGIKTQGWMLVSDFKFEK